MGAELTDSTRSAPAPEVPFSTLSASAPDVYDVEFSVMVVT